MQRISDFLLELDARWKPAGSAKQPLHMLGSCALMLQTDYERGTKDSDVLRTAHLSDDVRDRLIALAGKETALHRRHAMYIEVVPQGLPFLAHTPNWHPRPELNHVLNHFEVYVLDIVDVVVSKLARFHSNDRADVLAMVKRGLVSHAELLLRFEAAVDVWKHTAYDYRLPDCVRCLNDVERDYLGVAESDIELPSWVE